MKILIIFAIAVITFAYLNPPRKATIKLKDGTITTAHIANIVGKVTINKSYPVYKGILGEGYCVGTGDEIIHSEPAIVLAVNAAW